MGGEEYEKNPLWKILVDTVHAMVMYPNHKAYIRDVMLHEAPEISPQDLALKMGIPLGEALVILYELREEGKSLRRGEDTRSESP